MIQNKLKIFLIEDNTLLAENISTYLSLKDIEVKIFDSVEDVENIINDEVFDILVLDINLPGKSGLEYLNELRTRGFKKPIIMLTSNNTSDDIVIGFENGADEYISKPFNFEEFVARIKNLGRRGQKFESKKILIEIKEDDTEYSFEIDFEYKKVKRNGENIYLASLEYKLLEYLLKNRGKTISRDNLYIEVWGEFDKYHLSRTVDVYIGYLRKKLAKNLIKTKKGDGYYID